VLVLVLVPGEGADRAWPANASVMALASVTVPNATPALQRSRDVLVVLAAGRGD
jgi:hypothetical protein